MVCPFSAGVRPGIYDLDVTTPEQEKRAELVRRWVIFITVAVIGAYCVSVALKLGS
jgi:hypothetical protein